MRPPLFVLFVRITTFLALIDKFCNCAPIELADPNQEATVDSRQRQKEEIRNQEASEFAIHGWKDSLREALGWWNPEREQGEEDGDAVGDNSMYKYTDEKTGRERTADCSEDKDSDKNYIYVSFEEKGVQK